MRKDEATRARWESEFSARRGAWVPVWVVLGLLVVGPATFIVWALDQPDQLHEVTRDPKPLVVTVQEFETVGSHEIELLPQWEEPHSVLAPAWTGTVTRVMVGVADDIKSLTPILDIDQVSRIAYHSNSPFYRTLGLGDTGPDVIELHTMLQQLGLLAAEVDSDEITRESARAIAALAEMLGVPPTSRRPDFDPGWVVWMPNDTLTVGEVLVRPGMPAPAQGEPIIVTEYGLAEVTIQGSQVPKGLRSSAWVVELGTLSVDVIMEPSGPIISARQLEVMADLLEQGLSDPVPGRMRLKAPASRVAVPVSAISLFEDGSPCVWVVEDDDTAAQAVSLGPARGETVEIIDGLATGSRIIANPDEVVDTPCGKAP